MFYMNMKYEDFFRILENCFEVLPGRYSKWPPFFIEIHSNSVLNGSSMLVRIANRCESFNSTQQCANMYLNRWSKNSKMAAKIQNDRRFTSKFRVFC